MAQVFIPDVETEERAALRGVIRDLVTSRAGTAAVRSAVAMESGYDPDFWRAVVEIGLPALTIPEELGGVGGQLSDQVAAFQELGKALVPSPLFATAVLAAPLVVELDDADAAAQLLPRLADGSLTATVALFTDTGRWGAQTEAIAAEPLGDEWCISGARRFVIDGASAGLILVPGLTTAGPSVFAVAADAAGLSINPRESLDLTRRLADIRFDNVSARLIGAEGAASAALEKTVRRGILALVAEQAGAAEHLVAISLDYAKTRYQFGRLIGEFQAIKHKLADMVFDLERLKSVLRRCVEDAETGDAGRDVALHLAKAFASEALFRIAAETVQVHGGIGFTWEHEAHLYFRRAKSSEVLFGTPHEHREAMLGLLESAA